MTDDTNVTSLKPQTIPPFVVVNTLKENVHAIEAIYVVTIEDGRPVVYASGDLRDLAIAAVTLQAFAVDHLQGRIHSGND